MENSGKLFSSSLLLLIVFVILTSVQWVGTKDFYTRGEPREALVAQNILQGNWILPEGYNGAVPSKPPLLHWLIAGISLPLASVDEFTARLPSALASFLFLIGFYVFLFHRKGEVTALLAVTVLATTIEWFESAVVCRVDMLLTACTVGALCCLYQWFEKSLRGVPWVPIFLLTGATLTKGPIGFLLPGIIFALFLLVRGSSVRTVAVKSLLVVIPVISLSLVWYYAGYQMRGDEFLEKIRYENIQRFTGAMESIPHHHPAPYLWATLLIGFFPWSLLLGIFAFVTVKKWRSGARTSQPLNPIDSYSDSSTLSLKKREPLRTFGIRIRTMVEQWRVMVREGDSFKVFALLSALTIVVFYSLPASKRGVYLLPAYPFIAVLVADYLGTTSFPLWLRRWGLTLAFFFIVVSALLLTAAFADLVPQDTPHWFLLTQSLRSNWLLLLGATVLSALTMLWYWKAEKGYQQFAWLFLICLGIGNVLWFPPYANSISGKEFAARVQPQIDSASRILSWGTEFYGLSFYLKHPFLRLEEHPPQAGDLVIVEQDDISSLQAELAGAYQLQFVERSLGGVGEPKGYVVLFQLMPRS